MLASREYYTSGLFLKNLLKPGIRKSLKISYETDSMSSCLCWWSDLPAVMGTDDNAGDLLKERLETFHGPNKRSASPCTGQ